MYSEFMSPVAGGFLSLIEGFVVICIILAILSYILKNPIDAVKVFLIVGVPIAICSYISFQLTKSSDGLIKILGFLGLILGNIYIFGKTLDFAQKHVPSFLKEEDKD